MSSITTHILDTSLGQPAARVKAVLALQSGADWQDLGQGVTNSDGRIAGLLAPEHCLQPGVYRLQFETQAYFERQQRQSFYPRVDILFHVVDGGQHYHVPLLLNPYGYSTYRGS